jgi:hypothetical protein
MSKDGVVPPQGGPSRRPAGGPANLSGDAPQGPAARRHGTDGRGGGAQRAASDRSESAFPEAADAVEANTDELELVGAAFVGAAAGAAAADALDFDLSAALRSRLAVVGAAGPPPGGLTRIRRKARARQRNRAVLAGSASVLMLAVGVTLATGDRFDIVPTLSGAVGLTGGAGSANQAGANGSTHASTAADGGRVVWPTGTTGSNGLAIGPVAPVTSTPSAAVAAKLPVCTAETVHTSTTVGPTVAGVVYGYVDAVAQSACVAVGPPVLTVANQASTAASSVTILKADRAAAAQLPDVPTWGTALVLAAGQGYQFQFAWAATACASSSASPTSSNTAATSANTYYLGYAVTGTKPATAVIMTAACGAQVYVTDIYQPGAFPLPKAPSSPPPATSASAAPPPTTAAPSTVASTPPPDTSSASPSDSAPAPNGVTSSGDTTPSGN